MLRYSEKKKIHKSLDQKNKCCKKILHDLIVCGNIYVYAPEQNLSQFLLNCVKKTNHDVYCFDDIYTLFYIKPFQ